MSNWVRLWEDMPTDPKWRVVARKSGQTIPAVIAVFTMLMVEGGKAGRSGDVSGARAEDIAAALDMDDHDVEAILEAMQGRVIEGSSLSGWDKRQPKREDSSTQRVRDHRERKSAPVKRDETQCNAPDTEAEADTEKNISNASALDVQQPQDDLALTEAVAVFNSTAADVGWSKVQSLNPTRRTSLKARLRECGGIDGWRAAMARARASPFLTGEGGREWRADFDFFLKASKFTKLMEGAYDRPGRPIAGVQARPDPRPSGTQRALAGLAQAASERSDSRLFAMDTGGAGFGRGPAGDGGGNGGSSGCPPLRLIDG